MDIPLERIENDVVFFKAPSPNPSSAATPSPTLPASFKTGLYDLKPLGLLSTQGSSALYLVASGKKCQDCPFEKGVHIFSLQTPANSRPSTSLVHPGKVIDSKTGALLLESRSFFGSCLPGKGDVYVTFQREKVDRRSRLQLSVLLIETAPDGLREKLLERGLPRLDTVLRQIKRKSCTEIGGRNRHSISTKTALIPAGKAEIPDDEDADDIEPKESQTAEELKS